MDTNLSIVNTEIDNIIINIISGKNPIEINDIKEETHPRTFKPNYDTHKEQINQFVAKIENNDTNKKMFVLSRISYLKPNIIDIDLCVSKSDLNKIQYYFVGRDLAKYYRFLPCYELNLCNKKISIRPKTGTSHAKFYPDCVKDFMVEIAINLRMLDLYCKKCKMTTGYTLKKTKLLGLVIPFDIPEFYKDWVELANKSELDSHDNPVKISEGKFLFGKNGITNGRAGWMLNLLFNKYPQFNSYCCPRLLNTCNLNKFILSEYTFAVTSWKQHSRFIIKIKKSDDINYDNIEPEHMTIDLNEESDGKKLDSQYDEEEFDESINLTESEKKIIGLYNILIIDPWMKKLPDLIKNKLEQKNPLNEIKIFNRMIKDQSKEGSCVLCTLARLIYLITSLYFINKEGLDENNTTLINKYIKNLNTPIPDFYAYLVKFLYRKTN